MSETHSGNWLLCDVTYMQWDPPLVGQGDIRIRDGVIVEIGEGLKPASDETVEELRGHWVMPGLVCGHTHLYSALSCGMPMPTSAPISFGDMLDKVWWRLDRALDREAVQISASVGAVSALRVGVTTLIDHHASPNAIDESLLVIDDGLEQVGLRRILCYEVTDRGGDSRRNAGLRAHEQLLSRPVGKNSGGKRAVLIGAHANFTLSDETLRRCADLARDAGVGLHIHVAEAIDDTILTKENPVLRLERLGALRPGSILAHCVHSSADDLQRIVDAGAWIAHQPRSNMNNSVGYAPVHQFPKNTILGTDGIGADVLTEIQTGWFQGQENKIGWGPQRWLQMLQQGTHFASLQLGQNLGQMAVGGAADLVVLDPPPGPPLTADNLAAAVIFRLSPHQIRHVMIDGVWRLRDQTVTGLSMSSLDEHAQEVSQAVWSRMDALS